MKQPQQPPTELFQPTTTAILSGRRWDRPGGAVWPGLCPRFFPAACMSKDAQPDPQGQRSAPWLHASVGDQVERRAVCFQPYWLRLAGFPPGVLSMRKAKVVRLVFALCLGCFLMVILYFNSSLKPGKHFYSHPNHLLITNVFQFSSILYCHCHNNTAVTT